MAPGRRKKQARSRTSVSVSVATSSRSVESRDEIKEAAAAAVRKMNELKEAKLKELEQICQLLLFTTPPEILEMPMEPSWEALMSRISEVMLAKQNETSHLQFRRSRSVSVETSCEGAANGKRKATHSSVPSQGENDADDSTDASESQDRYSSECLPTVKKRRSRSVGCSSSVASGLSSNRRRSRSVADPIFQTPGNSSMCRRLMSHKKYTVRRPIRVADSAFELKRYMRPGEEAISISGSPLIVQGSSCTEPQVTIPLPGGMVVNISTNKVTNTQAAALDPQMRQKIKIIHENLGKLIRK